MSSEAKKLKKELKLLDVFAIATGSTLSAGFFLLPGIAAKEVGTALVFSYMIAAIPLIPAMFSKVELATGLPKAGGVYYFLDRTMGPLIGTIGGFGTWLALILKVSFALIGMSAYIRLFFPSIDIVSLAIFIAIALGFLNAVGAKKSGQFQIVLVAVLLLILIAFISYGAFHIELARYSTMTDVRLDNLLSSAGLVYVSYVGITKVASVAEEVEKPEKYLPLGVFLSLTVALSIYLLGTLLLVGLVPIDELKMSLTPIALAAEKILGETGVICVSVAALFAFISVANAGTMSASRYPLAMSRDHVFPPFFRHLDKKNTPIRSIVVTVSLIILILLFLDPLKIAKLASAFQLLLFAMVCLAVIIIRESKIESYDPGYKSPFYPWMQIIGIVFPLILITQMGTMAISFSSLLLLLGFLWYWYYARHRVLRNGAIYHIFERLGKQRYEGLDREFRGILKDKGLRDDDPFDKIVMRSYALDAEENADFESLVTKASKWFSQLCSIDEKDLRKQFLDGTRIGATPVSKGVALPHIRVENLKRSEIVMLRSKNPISITVKSALSHYEEERHQVYAIFFLMSPEEQPGLHLRILAQIAGRVESEDFKDKWLFAADEQELKEAVLSPDIYQAVTVRTDNEYRDFIGRIVMDLSTEKSISICLIKRKNQVFVPTERTLIENADRLSIIYLKTNT